MESPEDQTHGKKEDETWLRYDDVEHPAHYTSSLARCVCGNSIECIEIARHMTFNLGNVVKYIWRAGLKGDAVTDLRKAAWYLDDEIKRLKNAGK